MSKILVCQHVPYEILGTLDPLFRSKGMRIRYVNFGRDPHAKPNLEGYQGLVVLGGPMNVGQDRKHPHLKTEIKLIEDAIKKDIPVLGICLGAQLIAKALGAKVFQGPMKEIGWFDITLTKDGRRDPVFKAFRKSEKIFEWHGCTFDIPYGAHHLAASSTCENQAFRYGKKVYGLQFHLEVDEHLIKRWLRVPNYKKELAHLKGQTSAKKILEDTTEYIDRSTTLSDKTFLQFCKLFGRTQKSVRLSSR